MANAAVGFLLENLNQLQLKATELLGGVNDELKSLSVALEGMQSFLKDFQRESNEHESLELLVNQIRDLAYDVEDIIDDYVVSATEYRSKWKRYLPGSGKLTAKRHIGKRIKEIKKTTEEIYCTGKKLGIEIKRAGESVAEGTTRVRARRAPIVEEDDVLGFGNEIQTLLKRLNEGDLKRASIGIVGMGGLGKTTLAKRIYNDKSIKLNFELRGWVYVSQVYTLFGLILGILKSFTRVTDEMKEMNEEELGKMLHGRLKGKKYLVVMDDVWKHQVWENLEEFFPDESNGSRILFTTRNMEVAVSAISDPMNPPYMLSLLNKEESWQLFRKKALLGEECPPQWEKIGRQIAEKCNGLPLAIVVLGSLISQKQGTFDEWSRVANRVSVVLSQRSAECKEILALSYYELPYYIKPCFLYLSAFPEDYQFPARQLIELWVAEGFIKANPEKIMEDIAEKYLEMLVDRSLLQVVERRSDGRVKICCIHNLLHELCISEAAREIFLEVHGSASPAPVHPRRLSGDATTIRHISDNVDAVKQLRSLLCFTPKSDVPGVWSRLFRAMRFLRVFKVSDVGVIPKEVEHLPLLKYLGLDRISFLEIPSSICHLYNLQVLDARCKSIRSAPDGFWNLRKLRHVYFHGSTILPQPQTSSSSSSSFQDSGNDDCEASLLKELQTLSTICASSCTPEVFQKLPNLLRLGVKGDLNALSGNLGTLKHLQSLKLVKAPGFPSLTSLPLDFPPNLTKLTLCETQLNQDPMPFLGKLPNLQFLKLLSNAYVGRNMVLHADGFLRLQLLKLVSLEHVEELTIEEGTFPKFDHLIIHDCQSLKWLSGLSFLSALQIVDLQKPTNMLRQSMQNLNEKRPFQLQIIPLREDKLQQESGA